MTRPELLAGVAVLASLVGCRDLERWSSGDGRYEGSVTNASFVRAGIAESTKMCLTFDASHLEDRPGSLTSSDGRFAAAPLVPIAPLAHDPLALLAFGADRSKNLVFAVRAESDAGASDVLAIVSLMDSGDAEVRLLRPSTTDSGVFAVFALQKKEWPCSFRSP